MKKIFLTFLFLIVCASLYGQTLKNSSSNGLNMRSAPNTSGSVVASIPPNGKVTVVDKSNSDWYKVRYDGKTGYVSSKYLSEEGNTNNNSNNSNKSNSSSQKKNNSGNYSANYKTGIGFRFGGWESGLTVKHFIKGNAAIEGILSTGWANYGGTRIIGLYEIQKTINGAAGLSWFYGVGGHIGSYNDRYWNNGDCKDGYYYVNGRRYSCDTNRLVIGIDGIIGLEYLFQEIPITLGLDLKPFVDIVGWGGSHFGDIAFTARYTF